MHKEAVADGVAHFKKRLPGRIDAVIYPESAGIDPIHKIGIDDRAALAVRRFSNRKDLYSGIPERSHVMEDRARVEAGIRTMIASGEIGTIVIRYSIYIKLPVPAR